MKLDQNHPQEKKWHKAKWLSEALQIAKKREVKGKEKEKIHP